MAIVPVLNQTNTSQTSEIWGKPAYSLISLSQVLVHIMSLAFDPGET